MMDQEIVYTERTTVPWHSNLCQSALCPNELLEHVFYLTKKYGVKIFNQGHYNTYYGHFGHYIVHFLLNGPDVFNRKLSRATCYLNLLFHLVENEIISVNTKNYYNETPLDILQRPVLFRRNQITTQYFYKTLEWILQKKLVIVQQSFVRRWLAMRKLQRLRLKKALLPIVMAPPGQIGFVSICHFEGGSEFMKCYSDYQQLLI